MIRELEAGEWPRLCEMIRAASLELERYGTPRYDEALIALVHRSLMDCQPVFVAVEDGRPVGYCAWVKVPGTPEGLITGAGTYVDPEHRRRGLAKELRAAAADHWRERGARCVRGTVAPGNDAAREALGSDWSVVGLEMEKVL